MENKFKEIFVKRNRFFPVVAYTTEVPESDKYIEYAAVEQVKAELRMSDLNRQSLWVDSLKLVDENAEHKSKLKTVVTNITKNRKPEELTEEEKLVLAEIGGEVWVMMLL